MNSKNDEQDGHMILFAGQLLGGRYRVTNFLGKGTFGKVVQVQHTRSNMMLALKISLKGNEHRQNCKSRHVEKIGSLDAREMAEEEVMMLKRINELDPGGKQLIIKLFDHFEFDGRICTVLELLGISVYEFQKSNKFKHLPPMQVLHVSYQLCHAVAFLHRNNIIHTDIKPENVVFVHADYDVVPNSYWYEGSLDQYKNTRILRRSEIRLIDFGAVVNIEYHKTTNYKISTREYRCVESVLGLPWGKAADIWSIGCTIFDMYCSRTLFEHANSDCSHLTMMETYLGPLPQRYLNIAPRDFLEQRVAKVKKLLAMHTAKSSAASASATNATDDVQLSRLHYYFGYGEGPEDRPSRVYSLVALCLEYNPIKRITAEAALRHPAFLLLENHLKIHD